MAPCLLVFPHSADTLGGGWTDYRSDRCMLSKGQMPDGQGQGRSPGIPDGSCCSGMKLWGTLIPTYPRVLTVFHFYFSSAPLIRSLLDFGCWCGILPLLAKDSIFYALALCNRWTCSPLGLYLLQRNCG